MVFVLSVLNRVYNSAEVCSKSVYMYFDLNGVFEGFVSLSKGYVFYEQLYLFD